MDNFSQHSFALYLKMIFHVDFEGGGLVMNPPPPTGADTRFFQGQNSTRPKKIWILVNFLTYPWPPS